MEELSEEVLASAVEVLANTALLVSQGCPTCAVELLRGAVDAVEGVLEGVGEDFH